MTDDMVRHLIARQVRASMAKSRLHRGIFHSIVVAQTIHEIGPCDYPTWLRRAKFAILCGAKP